MCQNGVWRKPDRVVLPVVTCSAVARWRCTKAIMPVASATSARIIHGTRFVDLIFFAFLSIRLALMRLCNDSQGGGDSRDRSEHDGCARRELPLDTCECRRERIGSMNGYSVAQCARS